MNLSERQVLETKWLSCCNFFILIKFLFLDLYLESCIGLQIELVFDSLMEANTDNCMLPAFEKWVIYGLNTLSQNCIVIKNITSQNPKSKRKSTFPPKNPPQTFRTWFHKQVHQQLHESHFDRVTLQWKKPYCSSTSIPRRYVKAISKRNIGKQGYRIST